MLVLLPPSETKRAGGRRAPLDVVGLGLSSLAPARESVVDALVALSGDPLEAARVLKLGPTQHDAVALNAALRTGPTMPAVDRYTGVLFDALGASSLDAPARRWLGGHVLIHSAPFGPIGALARIPSYRLGATATLPGVPSLKRLWAESVTAAFAELAPDFVLDLRSEAYVALGPIPASVPSAYVRVVAEGPDGVARALNHFNKHAKGELVRLLAVDRPRIGSVRAFRRWAAGAGVTVRDGSDAVHDGTQRAKSPGSHAAPGELHLVV
jgi:cytoplasmic iron level regulating protein YaaA (DUF328/UPF0246 family)